MNKLLTLTLLSTLSMSAMADASYYSEQYSAVSKIELYEVTENAAGERVEKLVQAKKMPSDLEKLQGQMGLNNKGTESLGQILMVTKNLIALGKEIYKIVEAGRPVVNMGEATPVSVLPRDEKGEAVEAFYLSNWSAPRAKTYKIAVKNYMGMTPVSFEFMVIYSYGGNYNGKGRYITGAQIRSRNVNVAWGYNFDANFSVQSIVNQGSASNPVAGVTLMVDYTISTVLKESKYNKTFFVNGMGQLTAY